MIRTLNPYPAMKDSGVPWLGQVPEHWDVVPALAVYKSRGIKNTDMVEKTVLSLSYGRIVIKPEEKLRGLVPESFETYQIVEPGNIIVRTTDLQNDKNSLRIGHAKVRGIITSAYMCLETTDRVLNEFGYQYLNAYDLLKIIYGYGSGLRQNLDFKDIRRMPVLVPSHDEQAAIVRYLDYADRRIRSTIAAKQQLIKLLQEQKQVIIHQAVTRGLDPDVKLKPSGVEWLGDVPEGWKTTKLFHACDLIVDGTHFSPFNGPTGEYKYITAKNIKTWGLDLSKITYVSSTDHREIYKRCPVILGDILYIKDGATAGIAAVNELPEEFSMLSSVALIRTKAHINPFYLALLLNSERFKRHLLSRLTGGAMTRFTIDLIKTFKIIVPTLREQVAIVEEIKNAAQPLDQAMSRAQQEISLLREYRTRLIADVVTGKVDVRAAAAQLPDLEGELPEEFDVEIEANLEGDEPETEAAEALA